MVWFFERDGETLRIDTTHDPALGEYVVTVRGADGSASAETFHDGVEFRHRLEALEQHLLADHWTPSGSALLAAYPDLPE